MLFRHKTVGEWLKTWLETRSGMLRPRTVQQYETLIRLHAAPIGALRLDKVKPAEIEKLLGSICAEGHERTAEQLYILLKSAFSAALRLGEIKNNPMSCVMRPRHHTEPHKVWSREQQRTMIAAAEGTPYELALLLGLACGLRRGEICGLRWSDVDLTEQVLHIRNQRQRIGGKLVDHPPKSNAGSRDVPFPAALRPLLARNAQIGGYVCPLSPEGLRKGLYGLCSRAGVPWIGIHGLRHTMATNCIDAGVNLRIVQGLLGHASFSLTASVYTHPNGQMMGKGVACAWECVV